MTKLLLATLIFCAGIAVGQYYNPVNVSIREIKEENIRMQEELGQIKAKRSMCIPLTIEL
jgi:hypothetical protein